MQRRGSHTLPLCCRNRVLHYIGTQPSPSLRRSVHTQSCIRMHTHTCMHSSMHACVHMRTYMHACIGALHRNPRRPREGRAPHMHGVRGGWLTRRLARCVERCPLHVCTHVYGCSVRGALPPACVYACIWMLSVWPTLHMQTAIARTTDGYRSRSSARGSLRLLPPSATCTHSECSTGT